MVNPQRLLQAAVISVCLILCLSVNVFSSWPEFWLSSGCTSGSAYQNQSAPSVAMGQTNLLAVWEDERVSPNSDIFGARITPDGEVLDPSGIAICTAGGWQTSVKVAGGDENYLVVWQDDRYITYDIYGARIDLDGNVLDPDGFPISAGESWEGSPDVAWDGTNFLVVWTDDRSTGASNVYGTRITPEGEILDGTGFQISDEAVMVFLPSVTFNGSNYLVVWESGGG